MVKPDQEFCQALHEVRYPSQRSCTGPCLDALIPATMPEDEVKTFGQNTLFKRPAQPVEQAAVYVFLASDIPVMSRVRSTAPLAARPHSRVLESDLAFQVSVVVPRKQILNILRSADAKFPIPTGLTDGQPPALGHAQRHGQKHFVGSGCFAPNKPIVKVRTESRASGRRWFGPTSKRVRPTLD